MAGKRQHFIPQFLQRGFASHFSGNEAFTWVYRKDTKPFNSNIKNIGVEGYFYTLDGDTELDKSITDLEGTFNEIILGLRHQDPAMLNNSEEIAKLLAHLEIRTRHLRKSFLESGTYLMDELLKHISNEEVLARYFQKTIQSDPYLIENAMAKEIQKLGIPIEYLPDIMELSEPLLEKALHCSISMMSHFSVHFRNSLPTTMKEVVKSGHIKALTSTLAPESKVDRFRELQFRIISAYDIALPLGDSMVLYHMANKTSFKPFFEGKDELLGVFLPLSPHHVLVGSKGKYDFELSKLRQEIVGCSLEHFISSGPPSEYENLLPFIGKSANLLSNDQIKMMVNKLING